MTTTLLELIGLALLVAAAYVAVGLAGALAAAGTCSLWASWSLTRDRR